jgi:hypothetical protein
MSRLRRDAAVRGDQAPSRQRSNGSSPARNIEAPNPTRRRQSGRSARRARSRQRTAHLPLSASRHARLAFVALRDFRNVKAPACATVAAAPDDDRAPAQTAERRLPYAQGVVCHARRVGCAAAAGHATSVAQRDSRHPTFFPRRSASVGQHGSRREPTYLAYEFGRVDGRRGCRRSRHASGVSAREPRVSGRSGGRALSARHDRVRGRPSIGVPPDLVARQSKSQSH